MTRKRIEPRTENFVLCTLGNPLGLALGTMPYALRTRISGCGPMPFTLNPLKLFAVGFLRAAFGQAGMP